MKFFPPSEQGPAGPTGATGAAGPSNVIHESSGPTDLTVGAVLDGEGMRRVGSTAVGRFVAVVGPSTALSDPGNTNDTDVPGLSVALPRAGTYWFSFTVPITVATNPTTIGVGVDYSGTVTALSAAMTNSAGAAVQTVAGTLGTFTNAITALQQRAFAGTITVSTAGTLSVQVNRASNTITVAAGGGGLCVEK